MTGVVLDQRANKGAFANTRRTLKHKKIVTAKSSTSQENTGKTVNPHHSNGREIAQNTARQPAVVPEARLKSSEVCGRTKNSTAYSLPSSKRQLLQNETTLSSQREGENQEDNLTTTATTMGGGSSAAYCAQGRETASVRKPKIIQKGYKVLGRAKVQKGDRCETM